MSDEDIEKLWRIGHSLTWIIKEYEKKENIRRKQRGLDKVSKQESKKYVTEIIFRYQTAIMRGERSWT